MSPRSGDERDPMSSKWKRVHRDIEIQCRVQEMRQSSTGFIPQLHLLASAYFRPPLISAPMFTVSSRVTRLSATFPQVFMNCNHNLDPFVSSCKNVLAIDLVEIENPDNPIQTSDKVRGYPKRVLREDLTSDSVRMEREMLKASPGTSTYL